MKGIRFRSQESMVHVETYEAFGATPVPIDNGNTLMSVQTGVVDGFDNTPLFAMAASWYQGLKEGERNSSSAATATSPRSSSTRRSGSKRFRKTSRKSSRTCPTT